MFCPNCGSKAKDDSRYCIFCGQKLVLPSSEKNVNTAPVKRIKLQCSSCGAPVSIDDTREVLFCPFCGSQELIDDGSSDVVKISRMKYNTEKEMQKESNRHEEKMTEREERIAHEQTETERARAEAESTKAVAKLVALMFTLIILMTILVFIFFT